MRARTGRGGRRGLRAAAAALSLAAASVTAGGCGYRFVGPGSQLPGGVRSVCVPMLTNLTSEPAAQTTFSRSLAAAVAERGLSRGGAAGCDATLEGSLVALSYGPSLLTERGPTFRADATLQLTLRKGDAVLGTVQVSRSEDLLQQGDVLAAEANFEAALYRLADDLAREALAQLAATVD